MLLAGVVHAFSCNHWVYLCAEYYTCVGVCGRGINTEASFAAATTHAEEQRCRGAGGGVKEDLRAYKPRTHAVTLAALPGDFCFKKSKIRAESMRTWNIGGSPQLDPNGHCSCSCVVLAT